MWLRLALWRCCAAYLLLGIPPLTSLYDFPDVLVAYAVNTGQVTHIVAVALLSTNVNGVLCGKYSVAWYVGRLETGACLHRLAARSVRLLDGDIGAQV